MVMIMNFFGHDHDHYKTYDRCNNNVTLQIQLAVSSQQNCKKYRECVKKFQYETKTSTDAAQYAAAQKQQESDVFVMIMVIEKSLTTTNNQLTSLKSLPMTFQVSVLSCHPVTFTRFHVRYVKIMVRNRYLLHTFTGNFVEQCSRNDIRLHTIGMSCYDSTGY